jgi:hypothetical protein
MNQKGFVAVELVLVTVILALVGGTAFYVWNANSKATKTLNLANDATKSSTVVHGNKKADPAPPAQSAVASTPAKKSSSTKPAAPSTPAVIDQLPKPTGQVLDITTVSLSSDTIITSTCHTLPGLSCYIMIGDKGTYPGHGPWFITSGGVGVADSNGDVTIKWTAKNLPITDWPVWFQVRRQYLGQNQVAEGDNMLLNVTK